MFGFGDQCTVADMPRGGVSEANIHNFMRAEGAAARVRRYQQQAHRFRGLAQIESNEKFREVLVSLAQEYETLAASLVPQQEP